LPDLAGRLEVLWEDGSTAVDTEVDLLGETSNVLTDEHLWKKFKSMSIPEYGYQKTEKKY
jgi:hypothetical protein